MPEMKPCTVRTLHMSHCLSTSDSAKHALLQGWRGPSVRDGNRLFVWRLSALGRTAFGATSSSGAAARKRVCSVTESAFGRPLVRKYFRSAPLVLKRCKISTFGLRAQCLETSLQVPWSTLQLVQDHLGLRYTLVQLSRLDWKSSDS